MKGRIIAKANGVEMRNRIYRNQNEQFSFLELFQKENPDYEIDIIEADEPEMKPLPALHEKHHINNWYGSISVGVADKITLKRFGLESTKLQFEQVKTIWQEMGKPMYFRLKAAQKYYSQLSHG